MWRDAGKDNPRLEYGGFDSAASMHTKQLLQTRLNDARSLKGQKGSEKRKQQSEYSKDNHKAKRPPCSGGLWVRGGNAIAGDGCGEHCAANDKEKLGRDRGRKRAAVCLSFSRERTNGEWHEGEGEDNCCEDDDEELCGAPEEDIDRQYARTPDATTVQAGAHVA